MNSSIDRALRSGSAARTCAMTDLTACRPVDDSVCLGVSTVTCGADTMTISTSLNRAELAVRDCCLYCSHRRSMAGIASNR